MSGKSSESVSANEAPPKQSQRLLWVDFAKSAAIVLVVLYHVGGAGVRYLFPNEFEPASILWDRVNQVFLPMRMPLFFLTAGLLAHSAIYRDWRTVWKRRILFLLWPYIIWSVVFGSFAGFAYYPESPFLYMLHRWAAIPLASTAYWFLAVLIVFFMLAKALRRQRALVLVATVCLAISAPFVEPIMEGSLPSIVTYAFVRVLRYSVWYFLGCYGFAAVKRGAELNPWLLLGVGGLLFGGLTWLTWSFDLSAPLSLPVSAAGLVAAVGMSALAARNPGVQSWSTYLAQRTLPIYLLHPVLINLVALGAVLSGIDLKPNDLAATLVAPLLVIASVSISVVVYDCIVATRLEWIYMPPARFRALL